MDLMVQKYRFDKETYIQQISIQEWQEKRRNSVDRQIKTMSKIYRLNACKLDWEENLFNFYVESIVFRITIVIN